MERLRRRQQSTPPLPAAPAPLPAAAAPVMPAPETVQVTWGPMVDRLALAGMTVGEVRALLAVPYNIAPEAGTLVNGDRVGARHRLQAGEALEFVREGGEKG